MDNVKVYQAINAVQSDLCKEGISKNRKNQMQKYNFRGIDDVFNALSPLLSKHKLCILPRMISREVVERSTARGGVLFYVTLHAEFDFVSSDDASKHTVSVFGEAMDSSDKATNKAMSAAYKYACFQAFSIPTESMDDADSHSHDVVSSSSPQKTVNTSVKNDVKKIMSIDSAKELIKKSKNMSELKENWSVVWRAGFKCKDLDDLEIGKNDRKNEIKDLARSFKEETGVNVNA